jgi:hypothetical protein
MHGLGRAIEKVRLAPHPKSLRVEVVDVTGEQPKILETFAAQTPALKPEGDGLDEAAVWDATLAVLEAQIGRWSGHL